MQSIESQSTFSCNMLPISSGSKNSMKQAIIRILRGISFNPEDGGDMFL
jgi:hypothetical protein